MSNIDWFNYEGQKSAAGSRYGTSTAKNAYARFLAQQRGSRKKFDIQQGYEVQAPRVVSGFTRRGLAGPGVRSGIYEKSLSDFAKRNFDELLSAQREVDDAMRGYDLEDADLLANYQQEMLGIEAEKQRRIAEAAATLTSFKPFLS
jgi:hypothetical protein